MEKIKQMIDEAIKQHETRLHKKSPKSSSISTPKLREYSTFDSARELYPGTKRGLDTEFINFRKKHKNWKDILPLLFPAIQAQVAGRRKIGTREFIPPWKNFKTWINNRCWEEEGKAVDKPETSEEKTKREKAEAAALEKRAQEIRDGEGRYYRAQPSATLEAWVASSNSMHIIRRWLIREILEERAKQ